MLLIYNFLIISEHREIVDMYDEHGKIRKAAEFRPLYEGSLHLRTKAPVANAYVLSTYL